jgi:hypothetical protein
MNSFAKQARMGFKVRHHQEPSYSQLKFLSRISGLIKTRMRPMIGAQNCMQLGYIYYFRDAIYSIPTLVNCNACVFWPCNSAFF